MADTSTHPKRRRINRVIAACDLCKSRKVKCDGCLPCAYCTKRDRTCTFSTPRTRTSIRAEPPSINTEKDGAQGDAVLHNLARQPTVSPLEGIESPRARRPGRRDDHADTAVPLEAQLLFDNQGTTIFVGDCAPLSFLQTVRHLIASEVDSAGVLDQISRAFVIENAPDRDVQLHEDHSVNVDPGIVSDLIQSYYLASSGLVDLFDRKRLEHNVHAWANGTAADVDRTTSATYFLVLAIGAQERHIGRAQRWFQHAKDELTADICSSMTVSAVQGFALIALYMLRAFQANGAYLYFSLAARTAYAVGLHRTEVNASFGASLRLERDRIWKSLRVLDMAVSNLLGRPPSTSDVDCTVKYQSPDQLHPDGGQPLLSMIDASVRIFMIFERIVVEVYSRKRISLHIATYISRQLKDWASRWLEPLSAAISSVSANSSGKIDAIAACRIVCSYYNCIMLLTRPFLVYDIYTHLGAPLRQSTTHRDDQSKKEFADAAIDAAISCVETMQTVIESSSMPLRMPLVVAWLFTTSLVLSIGVMGRSGLSLEVHSRASIRCLEYFAQADPHARQYLHTVQSLLAITTRHVRDRELRQHNDRKRASSRLFGLHRPEQDNQVTVHEAVAENTQNTHNALPNPDAATQVTSEEPPPPDWTIYDADFFALPGIPENDLALQDFLQPGRQTTEGSLADIPLFPMYDQVGASLYSSGT